MATTSSLAAIVEAPHRDNINRVFRALTFPPGSPLAGIPLDESPDPGATFSVPLSPSGTPNPTHYGAFFTGDTAEVVNQIILGGFPTDIVWADFNLTAQKAQQAWNTLEITAADSDDISGDWSDFINGKGIKKIDDGGGI